MEIRIMKKGKTITGIILDLSKTEKQIMRKNGAYNIEFNDDGEIRIVGIKDPIMDENDLNYLMSKKDVEEEEQFKKELKERENRIFSPSIENLEIVPE